MKIPVYESTGTLEVPRTVGGFRESVPLAEAPGREIEQIGHQGVVLAHHWAVVEAHQEHARLAVQAAALTRETNQMAQEMIERPDISLAPQEAGQRAYQAMQERVQAVARAIPREDLRNQFTAHMENHIGSLAFKVRHATGVARINDAVAGDAHEAEQEKRAYQLEPTDEGRALIAQERLTRLHLFERNHFLTPKQAEVAGHKWLREANIGAAEYDGSIRPEETLRNLQEQQVNEQGQPVFTHYGDLTIQERSVAAHNIIAGRNARNREAREDRAAGEQDLMSAIASSIFRGDLGGPESKTGMPLDRRAIEGMIGGMLPGHQEWVRQRATEYENRTQVVENRASKFLAAQIMDGTVNAAPEVLTQKLQAVDQAAAVGQLHPDDAEAARRHLLAEQDHQEKASDRNTKEDERQEAKANKKAKARALRYRDTWFPVAKGPAGKLLDQQLLTEARAMTETLIADAIEKGEDPVKALADHKPEIEAVIYGTLKEARDAQDAILGDFTPKPRAPAKPLGAPLRMREIQQ